MISVDSPLSVAQNPDLAAFFGGTAPAAGDQILEADQTSVEDGQAYGELFASLIGGQENGFILSASQTAKVASTSATELLQETPTAKVLQQAETVPVSKGGAVEGRIDLSLFDAGDQDGIEAQSPLFSLSLFNGAVQISEPGATSFQHIQKAQDSLVHAATPLSEGTAPSQIKVSGDSLFPPLNTGSVPIEQKTSILPVKELDAILTAGLGESKAVKQVELASIQPNASTASQSQSDAINIATNPPAPADPALKPAKTIPTANEANALSTTAQNIEATEHSKAEQLNKQVLVKATSETGAISQQQTVAEADQTDADGQIIATQTAQQMAKSKVQAAQQPPTNANNQQAAVAAHVATEPSPNRQTLSPKAGDRDDKIKLSTPTGAAANAPLQDNAHGPNASRPLPGVFSPWSGGWTPESVSGLADGAGADLIAGGISGLKGDGGLLGGMSILGGKANSAMAGQMSRQLNLNVTKAVKAGEQEFAMRMDPPELGRVTVKLKFTMDGLVKAHVMAERPETMDMLQREVRGLERAIEAGGSKSADDGISFSLDDGDHESAGKAFAEALQQDKLQDQAADQDGAASLLDGSLKDDLTSDISLEEILAHITPETGVDLRV